MPGSRCRDLPGNLWRCCNTGNIRPCIARLHISHHCRHPEGVEPPDLGVLPPSYSLRRSSAPLLDSASEAILANLHRKSTTLSSQQDRQHGPETLKEAAQKCGSMKACHSATDWSEELDTLGGHKVGDLQKKILLCTAYRIDEFSTTALVGDMELIDPRSLCFRKTITGHYWARREQEEGQKVSRGMVEPHGYRSVEPAC